MGAPLYSLAVIPVALLCGNYVDNKINNQNAELSKKINWKEGRCYFRCDCNACIKYNPKR